MPRTAFLQKSFKHVCVDTVLFFAMFAVVGHLTINFWERYTIQTELSTMKHSLHTLKDTITNIGKAYDSLHAELKDLFTMVDKKETKVLMPQYTQHKDPEAIKCKNKYTLDHRNLHDFQVQTVMTKPLRKVVGIVTDDKHPEAYVHNKATEPFGRNATTNTKNPSKSTGVTSDMSKYEKEQHILNCSKRVHSYHNHLRCYKDHCRHVCHHSNARNL